MNRSHSVVPPVLLRHIVSKMLSQIKEYDKNITELFNHLHISIIRKPRYPHHKHHYGNTGFPYRDFNNTGELDFELEIIINLNWTTKTKVITLAHELGHHILDNCVEVQSLRKKLTKFNFYSLGADEEIVEFFATKWCFRKGVYPQLVTIIDELTKNGEVSYPPKLAVRNSFPFFSSS